jgi:hypothetical protein
VPTEKACLVGVSCKLLGSFRTFVSVTRQIVPGGKGSRKKFFFEKRNQKTFTCLCGTFDGGGVFEALGGFLAGGEGVRQYVAAAGNAALVQGQA